MHLTQAPPTCAAVTRRAVATAPVQLPQPGERGHLQHTLVSAIRARHYSRRTEQAYWHWTRQFVLWSGKRHPLELGAPEIGAFLSHLASAEAARASLQTEAMVAAPALRVDEVMATWRPKLLALKAALAGEEDRDRTRAILAEVLGTVKVGRDEQGRSYADMNEPAERLVLSAAGGSSLQVVAGACNLLERRLYMAG